VPTVTEQALCIRQWDWSETSQTVSLLGRDSGLVRAIAKGAKRENSRFSGGLEPLTRGEMIAILKPSADLGQLIAWDLQETFPVLRSRLSAFYAGMYMAELVHSALTERDPHPALFDALLAALRALGLPAAERDAVLRFQWATLVEAGYRPELDADIISGGPLAPARSYLFLARQGGFASDTGAEAPGAYRVRAETVAGLRDLAAGGTPAPETTERASRLLALYLREILGRDMPSMHAYFGPLTA
jgi:DNA repair protein RecO (recombination protein O)